MAELKSAPIPESKKTTIAPKQEGKSDSGELEYSDNRSGTVQLASLQAAADDKGNRSNITQLQAKASNFTETSRIAQLKVLSNARTPSAKPPIIQRQENKTGLPDQLKSGMESLSGLSLSDVKVHRNSDKPAQLQAYAYAQGSNIHLGPGQEKHLPHELGHVVQQKQGRVKPTVQLKEKVQINDNQRLEKEADLIGKKAQLINQSNTSENQLKIPASSNNLIQGKFSPNPTVYQFGGGEGGSNWIPAAVALGTGLFLVYRSWGQKKGEISADEAQEREYVSSEDVERDAKELDAEPSAAGSNGTIEPASSNMPVDPEYQSTDLPTLGGQAPTNGKKRSNVKFGNGPDYLEPVVPANNSSSGIASDYEGPQVTIGPNKFDATLLKAGGEIRTPDSTTEAQVEMGNMSYESNSKGVGAKVSSGNASVKYTGQNMRAKGNAEGPGAEIHYGENGLEFQGGGGEASAEVAGSVKGNRWIATAGAKFEAQGPNVKYGPKGKEANGPSTGVRAGFSLSRQRDPDDPASAKQVLAFDRKKGELPTAYLNGEEIYHILQEKFSEGVSLESGPEVEEAVDMYRASELGVPLEDLRKMQEDSSSQLPPTSFFEKIASFFQTDSSSSKAGDESSSEDSRNSSSSRDDSEEAIADSTEKASEETPNSQEESNEIGAEVVDEANDNQSEELRDLLFDYF